MYLAGFYSGRHQVLVENDGASPTRSYIAHRRPSIPPKRNWHCRSKGQRSANSSPTVWWLGLNSAGKRSLQYTATHCNTLQHTATHCTTLHHTATHCNTLHHTAPHCTTLHHTAPHCTTLHHTATHCNTLPISPDFAAVSASSVVLFS